MLRKIKAYQRLSVITGNVGKRETTRRTELKIEFRKECWFDPGQGHHSGFHPRRPHMMSSIPLCCCSLLQLCVIRDFRHRTPS
jgi:hypothetical protein